MLDKPRRFPHNGPEISERGAAMKPVLKALDKKTFGLWLLRLLLIALPVLPFFLLLRYVASSGSWMIFLWLILLGLDLVFALGWGRRYKLRPFIHWLQLVICWLPMVMTAPIWSAIIGRNILLMLGWPALLALWIGYGLICKTPLRREWLVHGFGAMFVLVALAASGMTFSYLLVFLLPLGALALLVRTLSRNDFLTHPRWLMIPILAIYGACMFQAFFIYTVDERGRLRQVVRQPSVYEIDLRAYNSGNRQQQKRGNFIRSMLFPITDVSAFLTWHDSLLFLPQHLNAVIRFERNGPGESLFTDNVTADNIVVDFYRRQFYFVVGSQLFRGSFDGLTFEPVQTFNLDRIEHSLPNLIDGYFTTSTARLMVQYEYDNGVMVYDALADEVQRVEVAGYRLRHSIWHPDGDKIIAVGALVQQGGPRLFVFDLTGQVMGDAVIQCRDLVFISRASGRFFYLTHFISGKVDKVSVDTLEIRRSLTTPSGARSTLEPPGSGCLLVSSFLRGTLNVYRLDDKRLLRSLYIGRRTRSIQPSLEDDSFLVSTSVGLLKIDAQSLLAGCPGEAATGAL
mgnify:FL=1